MANYKNLHFLFLEGSGGSKAAKIASSNTFFRPFCKSRKKQRKSSYQQKIEEERQ